jgi:hypothetical protein
VDSRHSLQELQIGGTGGNVPVLPALFRWHARRDGADAAVMGICRIFESSFPMICHEMRF